MGREGEGACRQLQWAASDVPTGHGRGYCTPARFAGNNQHLLLCSGHHSESQITIPVRILKAQRVSVGRPWVWCDKGHSLFASDHPVLITLRVSPHHIQGPWRQPSFSRGLSQQSRGSRHGQGNTERQQMLVRFCHCDTRNIHGFTSLLSKGAQWARAAFNYSQGCRCHLPLRRPCPSTWSKSGGFHLPGTSGSPGPTPSTPSTLAWGAAMAS